MHYYSKINSIEEIAENTHGIIDGINVSEIIREFFTNSPDDENGNPLYGTPKNISREGCLALALKSNQVGGPAKGHLVWNAWRTTCQFNENRVDFSGRDFHKPCINFAGFYFGNFANFKDSFGGDNTNFKGAQWGRNACFQNTQWGNGANFEGTRWGEGANFRGSVWGTTSFRAAQWDRCVNFVSVQFKNKINFTNAKFGDRAQFQGAQFGKRAIFKDTQWGKNADFKGVQFGDCGDFRGTKWGHEADFSGCTWEQLLRDIYSNDAKSNEEVYRYFADWADKRGRIQGRSATRLND